MWDPENTYSGMRNALFMPGPAAFRKKRKVLTEEYGAVVEQHGLYGDASGQYTYLDAQETLKCRIELLESFRK